MEDWKMEGWKAALPCTPAPRFPANSPQTLSLQKRSIRFKIKRVMKRNEEIAQDKKNVAQRDVLPENFDSLEEFWGFWDTQSRADYEDLMTPLKKPGF